MRARVFVPGRQAIWSFAILLSGAACGDPSPSIQPVPPLRGTVPAQVEARPPVVQRYAAPRTASPIVVDGRLDEPTWEVAEWSRRFVDIEGDGQPAPLLGTRVALAWDDQALYIAARLEEPHLWATISQRDAVIFHDNDFEVFLDPDGDTHRYYELEINALGTVWDLFLDRPYRDSGRAVDEWDIDGLQSAVALQGTLNDPADEDEGWTVELALPWSGLRSPDGVPEQRPAHGDQWRINFSRVQWHMVSDTSGYHKATAADGRLLPEENRVWSAQGAINMHMPEMWGVVEFHTGRVGNDTPIPGATEDETVRWDLRRVYYAQRQYHETHGRFAKSLHDLGFDALDVTMETSEAGVGYRALSQRSSGVSWAIDQTGRVWRHTGSTPE